MIYSLLPYGTLAMTVGLALARPRLSARVRVGPAAAGVLGVLILVATGIIGRDDLARAGAALWRPLLTISSIWILTSIAASAGILDGLARRIDAGARGLRSLFARVFWVSAAATVLFNNDSAVMVLTPLVIELVRRRHPGRPELVAPFAFAVFLASGVAPLIISNPMNMIVAEYAGLRFNEYAIRVIPIWLLSTAVTFGVLLFIFRRRLRETPPVVAVAARAPLAWPGARLIAILLLAVLIAYPVVTGLGGPVWAVAAAGAALGIAVARRFRLASPSTVGRAVSFDILIFLYAVSVVGIGLRKVGLVHHVTELYAAAGGYRAVAICGLSAAGSAVLNNHPMSMVNMMALEALPQAGWRETLAALIGGDLGPRLLPMGSLAGLIWLEALRRQRVSLSLGAFLRVGASCAMPALAAALGILLLQ